MKPELFKQKFEKAFQWYGNESSAPGKLKLELDLYKKLLNFLLVGDSYYFIIDHHTLTFELVSKEVEEVMGYSPSEFDIPFMNAFCASSSNCPLTFFQLAPLSFDR